MIISLESSAATKVLLSEPETEARRAAIRVGAALFVSYDHRQGAADAASGLHVVAPGQ